jgi:ABC-type lipoprotein export system ATPase subunit
MVTHDPHAAGYGDRLITLRDGLIESEEILRDRTGGMLSRPRYVSG